MSNPIIGKVNSIQSLGALDGPGIRFVVFLQGCNLRCGCCHNPDTWDIDEGSIISADEIVQRAENYREYFGDKGGITISGGEPLLQAEFCTEIFSKAKKRGINTCLDTSGSILNKQVEKLLSVTDRVLLDIKYTKDSLYKKYVGCNMSAPIEFLEYLNKNGIKTTLRQVIIPTLNDNEDNILSLRGIRDKYGVVEKIELLPFKKICQAKYDALKIPFAFKDLPIPDADTMKKLNKMLDIG